MSVPAMPTSAFDAAPLTEPIDGRAVRAFHSGLKTGRTIPTSTIIGIVLMSIFGVIVIPVLIFTFVNLAGGAGSPVIAIVPFALFVVVGGAIIAFNFTRRSAARRTTYRLDRFARANGMTFVDRLPGPRLPGMIFNHGNNRIATDLVRGTTPRFVEFGNYEYTTGSGDDKTSHNWGYVALKLDTALPNIVLDAKGNNGLGTNLPASFKRAQRLSLEGDFDRYFDLYCPEGYEQDTLYLFTPDVMSRFIDTAGMLDVEIVDDWLFLYTKGKVTTLDPATWAWLFGVVGALLTKVDQWSRWRDERLQTENAAAAAAAASASPGSDAGAMPFAARPQPFAQPAGVSTQGRRLKRGINWTAYLVGGATLAMWIWITWGR